MLLLLHGLSSDATTYMRFTSIERYAEAHHLAVIMPNAITVAMRIWLLVIATMTIY